MLTFRVHLSDGSKVDVQAETPEGARKKANTKAKSGVFVVKTKVSTAPAPEKPTVVTPPINLYDQAPPWAIPTAGSSKCILCGKLLKDCDLVRTSNFYGG